MSRVCGPCQACCGVEAIPSLDKPDWTRCPHQCAVGCGIHAERPEECREFDCLWLEGHGPEGDRPDLSGVIAWSSGDTGAHLFETRAGVVASPAGRACLERWRALRGPLRLFRYGSDLGAATGEPG
ncbi:MAG: hypothetical protein KDD82_27790 [Planctomycetes bacterium]|nr:hypothetical protein [Planctomycetota bacterium]